MVFGPVAEEDDEDAEAEGAAAEEEAEDEVGLPEVTDASVFDAEGLVASAALLSTARSGVAAAADLAGPVSGLTAAGATVAGFLISTGFRSMVAGFGVSCVLPPGIGVAAELVAADRDALPVVERDSFCAFVLRERADPVDPGFDVGRCGRFTILVFPSGTMSCNGHGGVLF